MYTVRTRNFKCRRFVLRLLELAPSQRRATVDDGVTEFYPDGDAKFYLETPSHIRAWLTWAWWMTLRPLSGGWTYIVRPGRTPDYHTYASVY